jgi:hypothetical protein
VVILERLLREHVGKLPQRGAPADGSRLGRVLFERRPAPGLKLCVWLLPVLILAALVAGGVTAAVNGRPEPAVVGAAISFVIGLVWLIPFSQCVTFSCHERGVVRRWMWREQQLPFDDVETFTYSAVKQYVKGVYSGTNFTLAFTSKASGRPAKLSYTKTLRNADAALEQLRDLVSGLVARRMAALLSGGGRVEWTGHLTLTPEGLEYQPQRFLLPGRKPPRFFTWSQITGFDASNGAFHAWVAGRKKPVIKESVAMPNFFPGYLVFVQQMAARSAPVATAG